MAWGVIEEVAWGVIEEVAGREVEERPVKASTNALNSSLRLSLSSFLLSSSSFLLSSSFLSMYSSILITSMFGDKGDAIPAPEGVVGDVKSVVREGEEGGGVS